MGSLGNQIFNRLGISLQKVLARFEALCCRWLKRRVTIHPKYFQARFKLGQLIEAFRKLRIN